MELFLSLLSPSYHFFKNTISCFQDIKINYIRIQTIWIINTIIKRMISNVNIIIIYIYNIKHYVNTTIIFIIIMFNNVQ
jgi:hypothetical protein